MERMGLVLMPHYMRRFRPFASRRENKNQTDSYKNKTSIFKCSIPYIFEENQTKHQQYHYVLANFIFNNQTDIHRTAIKPCRQS